MGYYNGKDTRRKIYFYANQAINKYNEIRDKIDLTNRTFYNGEYIEPMTGVAPIPGIAKVSAAEELGKAAKVVKLVKRGRPPKVKPQSGFEQGKLGSGKVDFTPIGFTVSKDGRILRVAKINRSELLPVENTKEILKSQELNNANLNYTKSSRLGSGKPKVLSVDTREAALWDRLLNKKWKGSK